MPMTMRQRATQAVLSFLLFATLSNLLLASCSYPPRVETFENSIGRLTQAELTRQFGYPQRVKKLPTGGEVWEYKFLSGNSRCVGYRVYFDQELLSQRWDYAPCR
jgi:hypothetical protein